MTMNGLASPVCTTGASYHADLMHNDDPMVWVLAIEDLDRQLQLAKAPGIYEALPLGKLRQVYESRSQALLEHPMPVAGKSDAAPLGGEAQQQRSRGKGRAIKTGEGFFLKTPLDAAVDPALSHTDYRLLSLLIILSGDKGCCWWSIDRLAAEMPGTKHRKGVSHDTIERSITTLVKAGYVTIVRPDELNEYRYKHHTSGNTYVLNLGLRGS